MTYAIVIEDEKLRIPAIDSLEDFRRWVRGDDFPEQGRIDYFDGNLEVDMSPEDLFLHNSVKSTIGGVLYARSRVIQRGMLFVDRARVTCPAVELSVEPDLLFVSHASVQAGIVRFTPRQVHRPHSYWEVEGPPDMVVEIVSDSSVEKDTKQLPKKYFAAGVPELWLIDARGTTPKFSIFKRGKRRYEAVAADKSGYQHSAVFNCDYRLRRLTDPQGWPLFELQERE